jgi:hypothetical protein
VLGKIEIDPDVAGQDDGHTAEETGKLPALVLIVRRE